MATNISNNASISYLSGTNLQNSLSNTASTLLIDETGIQATKQSHNTVWRPGENMTYVVQIENTGSEPLYNITITDNMAGGNLEFVEDSVIANVNGTLSNITPTATDPVTIVIPGPLAYGQNMTVTYVAKVSEVVDSTTTEITNVAAVQANAGSATGTVVTVTPSPSVTLPIANYASVTINKSSSETKVSAGEAFDYIFELSNSGNIAATNVVITDNLPANFTVTGITSTTNGVTTTYTTSDYTISAGNVLTLPTGTAVTLSVPAANSAGPGITTVNVTGTLASVN